MGSLTLDLSVNTQQLLCTLSVMESFISLVHQQFCASSDMGSPSLGSSILIARDACSFLCFCVSVSERVAIVRTGYTDIESMNYLIYFFESNWIIYHLFRK